MSASSNKNTCSVCGEILENDFAFCPSCGAAVKGSKTAKNNEGDIDSVSVSGKDAGNSGKKKSKKSSDAVDKKKNFSTVKMLYLILGLLFVVLFINYAGGVFDRPAVSAIPQENINQAHNGASLQSLQQINDLEAKVKANPSDMQSVLDLAHLLNDSGFKDKAIDKYKIYLKSDPKNSDVLVDMGVCYYELGKYDEAIKLMKQAISYQPNHQIAHLNLGIVTMTSGNHDEAIKWWKKAIEINPNNEIGKRAQELINSH